MDSVLAYSEEENSQTIEETWNIVDSGMVHKIVANKNRGDFIMSIGRNISEDTNLGIILAKYLKGYSSHHFKVGDFSQKIPDAKMLEKRLFALRTDITRFWYYREVINEEVTVNECRN